ncbi:MULTISPECIES: hypothetical protein [unclassified Iodidimonas]|uniref:hypothetical protein n=1 Tax=unclassified Iodidimonas TaxID=2626145 RepID=UPI00248259D1|nr:MULTISPECIES: hypothetical protein [unclassified Iodidimonas]
MARRRAAALLIMLGVFASFALRAQDGLNEAQAYVDAVSVPLFEAARIEPELRFPIKVIEDERPVAVMLGKSEGQISTAVLLLADQTEEVAAALARIIAEQQIDPRRSTGKRGYKMKMHAPGDDRLRGSLTSVDEAFARSSERAARETLNNREGYGPATEEIRMRARDLDSYVVELLRKADASGRPLMTLYEKMSRMGAGLFERDDYDGRMVLNEQIKWLADRVAMDADAQSSPIWQAMDDDLRAVQQSLKAQ